MSSFRLAIPLFLPLVVGLAFLTGACGAPLVTGASYAADGSLLATSNKTATDHLASMISKKDCYSQPQRMVSEDGVQYAPPLRAAPDAPAASWDAAAYKAAPAPAAPAVPVTAVADASSDPASAAPPKAKKPKVRSAKKPLRDRAAPAF